MTTLWYALLVAWKGLSPTARYALVAWVLATVSLPILKWIWGERTIVWGVGVGVVLQAGAVVAVLWSVWGPQRALLIALVVAGLGWTVEYVGSTTGFPFGRYHYTDKLQPQLGHVPLLIPLAWLMMLPPAWAIAGQIAGSPRWAFAAVSAVAFAAWDLFLDPQMVGWGLWVWDQPGRYFGIPWTNFAGWALAAAAMTAILRPDPGPISPLWLVYAITWLLETIGLGIFWRQPGPAVCGFLGMGSMLTWAWLTTR